MGLFKSTDGGANCAHLLSDGYVGTLAIDPQSPGTLYAVLGVFGSPTCLYCEVTKVFKSADRGATFMRSMVQVGG